jgi:hydroxyethylthiazole kinase-like uncharacterized protein yjeF
MNTLYRIEELRALESRVRAGLPPGTLMTRAGKAAALAVDRWIRGGAPSGERLGSVLVLCGPGDNGGDGFACASQLHVLGHACVCWAPLPTASADAQAARARWEHVGGRTLDRLPDAEPIELVVDALLGIGARRPLGDALLAGVRWTQARRLPVLALDVPSGLNADTGAWIGGVAGAPAMQTLTFLGDKPGLHTLDGIAAAGILEFDTLGTGDIAARLPAPSGRVNGPRAFGALTLPRPGNSNKGDYGAVAVVGGARGMTGAALLAARAALRLGAGRVFVDCIGAPGLLVDPLQPELMFCADADLPEVDASVVGCGLGTDAEALARTRGAIARPGMLVLDADALNCLAAEPALGAPLRIRAGTCVLTPHPGEAGRLLRTGTAEVQRDRVAAAVHLAQQFNAIVVLKGAGSIIAAPSGAYSINPTGGAALASAGTGDVLAGMIGALLAQHARQSRRDSAAQAAWEAVCAAVWLHGRAAQLHGADIGLTASEIAPLAARALVLLRENAAAHWSAPADAADV